MEPATDHRVTPELTGVPTNDRRAFLNLLTMAASLGIVASESVHAQQAPAGAQPARTGTASRRQPLPPPFTGLDAAFAQLTIRPGSPSAPPHTHSGFVLGYVIEGDYLFGINNETPRVVHAGEIFYEPPGATHTTHAGATPDQTVKLLAIIIGPQGAVTTAPAK